MLAGRAHNLALRYSGAFDATWQTWPQLNAGHHWPLGGGAWPPLPFPSSDLTRNVSTFLSHFLSQPSDCTLKGWSCVSANSCTTTLCPQQRQFHFPSILFVWYFERTESSPPRFPCYNCPQPVCLLQSWPGFSTLPLV